MKKALIMLAIAALLASSCNTRFPYEDAGLRGEVVRKDYEVLGPVVVEGTVHNILGIIGWGGIGYNDILKEAQRLYPDADAVLNVTKDVTSFSVGFIYSELGMEFSGLAISYLDGPQNSISVDLSVDGQR